MRYSKAQQNRIINGLCAKCGTSTDKTVYCSKCRQVHSLYCKTRSDDWRVQGLCVKCGGLRKSGCVHCLECLDKAKEYKMIHKSSIPRDVCTSCNTRSCLPSLVNAKLYQRFCQQCYIKRGSTVQLGASKYWRQLLKKLETQQFRCVYSGDEIVLGVNDSIDHIYPKSRYPELALDVSNIQWVTRIVNRMKDCLEHSEFIDVVHRIHARFS